MEQETVLHAQGKLCFWGKKAAIPLYGAPCSSWASILKAEVECIGLEAHEPLWGYRQRQADWMFQAAQDGCLRCVRECVEQKWQDIFGICDGMGYALVDHALYGIAKGMANTEEVLQYVKSLHQPVALVNPAQCVTYRAHVPERITGQVSKYYLFKAAEAGCLRCVQQYLEREFIEPLSVSDDGRSSTVLDFAEDATEKIRLELQPW